MEKFTVVIKKDHCVGTDYADANNCAACKAFREQYPGTNLRGMLWDTFFLKDGTQLKSDISFLNFHFDDLINGVIDKFEMKLRPMQSKEQEVQVSDTTKVEKSVEAGKQKEIIRYVKVSKEIEEMELVEN